MKYQGIISKWDGGRDIGYIKCADFEKELVFYGREYYLEGAPKIGERVSFKADKNSAFDIGEPIPEYVNNVKKIDDKLTTFKRFFWIFSSIIIYLFIIFKAITQEIEFLLVTLYLFMGLMSFCLYFYDRYLFINNKKRISNFIFYMNSLLGGWIMGLFARSFFRLRLNNKTFKRNEYICIVTNMVIIHYLFYANGISILLDLLFTALNK